ncbi:DUF6428 family protein [Flavobacterium aciduliphilum]|uniref:Uncharacterized protein n=1 Tax=Flavobacterium aciduliphilum TaxID=1101402 RepID=A0A328YBH6_9FLAO|nr:DUF6428 family protein [Flavobacterium aciduliphilum]RAR71289.1 hypothetical protein CLV55_10826 [Flavobacterium aciduliphilum]
MKLSDVKNQLSALERVLFKLPNGAFVPEHFHITEIGLVTKNFIDCGGTVRKESVVNFQLWEANDFEHRLKPQKLLKIIELSEHVLGIEDFEIEVEYQESTIGKYNLDFNGDHFELINKQTDCLAQDKCGIPANKIKVNIADKKDASCCTPNGKCC